MSLRLYGIYRVYFYIFKVRGRVKWKGNAFFLGEFGEKIRAKDNLMYFVAIERQLTRTAYNNK